MIYFQSGESLRYLYTPLFLVYISSYKNVYCHGEVVSVPATRTSPIPGSYLGLGLGHSVVCGAADHTVILYK